MSYSQTAIEMHVIQLVTRCRLVGHGWDLGSRGRFGGQIMHARTRTQALNCCSSRLAHHLHDALFQQRKVGKGKKQCFLDSTKLFLRRLFSGSLQLGVTKVHIQTGVLSGMF